MRIVLSAMLAAATLTYALTASSALAEDAHTVIAADQIQWGAAPPVLPAGAEAALLYGDPSKDGLFALRVKLPAGYAIPPHTHPTIEAVTVISGTFKLGMGEVADPNATEALPAGSFFALPTGHPHFVYADEETVIQISTNGPWGLTYVNPADNPQKTN